MAEADRVRALESNLRLYGWHQIVSGLLFWMPTSFLFFLERVDLGPALRLLALYFLAVVVLEVPSGWMSDRFGRVRTLRTGALSWIVAFAVFVLSGDSVLLLGVGQVLIAAGFAALSGTTSAFHFDTLEALERSNEFERRESAVARNGLVGTAVAVLIGGVLGLVDLRLPYVASLTAACLQFTITMKMSEIGHHDLRPLPTLDATRVRDVVRYLKHPGLAWIFVFMIVQQPLEGLALDQIQPWLALLTGNSLDDSGSAPLLSGLLVAVISLVGAASAATSHRLRSSIGLRPALVLLASIEALILVGMALTVSAWLLPLLALRSTQVGAGPVLVSAATAPLLARNHRATFLSLGSLAGRLTYGTALAGLGFVADFDTVLTISAAIGVGSVGVLIASGLILGQDPNDNRQSNP